MIDIIEAQYNWYVSEGTTLDRTDGSFPYWIIAHYQDCVDLQLGLDVVKAEAGTILILSPHTPHRYTCVHSLHHHWIHLDGNVAELLTRYDLKPGQLYATSSGLNDVDKLFRDASLIYHGRDPFRVEYMRLKTEEILVWIATQHHLPQEVHELNDGRLQNLACLRSKILEHPENEWSVPNMAASMYISEPYFYSIYRRRFGISPARDVQNIRLERACTMLRENTPVAMTAERCGYRNVYHFIRQFRRIIGVTPGKYAMVLSTHKTSSPDGD